MSEVNGLNHASPERRLVKSIAVRLCGEYSESRTSGNELMTDGDLAEALN